VFDAMLATGVTTVEAKSGYGLDTEEELRHLRVIEAASSASRIDVVPVFLGAHMPPLGVAAEDYVRVLEDEMLPAVAEQAIARLNDVTCEDGLFDALQARRLIAAGRRLGLATRVHADAFADAGGWRVAVEEGALSVDHLTFTPDSEIEALAGCDTVAIVLPVAELMYMTSRRANARLFRDSGIPLAIATDYCSSLGVLSTLSAMALAAPWFGLTPEEVVVGATINAAYALGIAESCGSLDVGKRGDVVLLRGPRMSNVFWRLATDGPTAVVKNGVVVK
jgi:imidazolonepropionase